MLAVVSDEQLELPPGGLVRLPGSWEDYQRLLDRRQERPLPRIKYRSGEILCMSPMPKHGREANGLADVAKEILAYQELDYVGFTPITMTLPCTSGIEPDYCFYVENHSAIVGKDRINWQIDPPPDWAIEVDVTSYTDIADYLPYAIPEVWLWKNQLIIYQFAAGQYIQQPTSRYLPDRADLTDLVTAYLDAIRNQSTRVALRQLRPALTQ